MLSSVKTGISSYHSTTDPVKATYDSVTQAGVQRKQSQSWAWPAFAWAPHPHPTVGGDVPAILCCCFSSLALRPTSETRMYNRTHRPRTLPCGALSPKGPFLAAVGPQGRARPGSGCAIHGRVRLSSCGNVSASVLDSLFAFCLSFPLSSQSEHQPDLFC